MDASAAVPPPTLLPPAGSGRRAVAALVLLAALVRAGWVLAAVRDPPRGPFFDMAWYSVAAAQIAAGRGLARLEGEPTAEWPPGYPALLALVYAASDRSETAGKLVNALYGALTTLFTYLLGRRLFGHRAGLWAAAIVAVYPGMVFYSAYTMSEVLFGALVMATAFAFAALETRARPPRAASWLALGLLLGAACLVRGLALGWLLVPPAIWALRLRPWREVARRSSLLGLGVALALAPWTLRNAVRLGAAVPISTSIGWTLAHAHAPWETGRPSLKTVVHQHRFRERFAHLPYPEREIVTMRAFTRSALSYMLTHPGHELRMIPVRLAVLFEHGHAGLEEGRTPEQPYFSPRWHAALARLADAAFYGVLLLGVLGLPRLLRPRQRAVLVVPLSALCFTAFHSVLFPAHPRYHFQTIPVLALSAAALLTRVRRRAEEPGRG
jgi:4-amino-4-deoxy-L-arabinose transferase-like glycosyltransferase